jgi:hypothetical protein
MQSALRNVITLFDHSISSSMLMNLSNRKLYCLNRAFATLLHLSFVYRRHNQTCRRCTSRALCFWIKIQKWWGSCHDMSARKLSRHSWKSRKVAQPFQLVLIMQRILSIARCNKLRPWRFTMDKCHAENWLLFATGVLSEPPGTRTEVANNFLFL